MPNVKTDRQSVSRTRRITKFFDGEITVDTDSSNPVNWTDTRTGVDLPTWRARIKRGLSATTDYDASMRKLRIPPVHAEMTRKYTIGYTPHESRVVVSGCLDPGWGSFTGNVGGLSETDAERSARWAFIKKYRGRRTAFQSGVFLGELRETVQMIRRPALALRRGIDEYVGAAKKRIRGLALRRKREIAAETWLEYSFGWKPLVSDIEDACRLATQHPHAAFERITSYSTNELDRVTTTTYYHNTPLIVRTRATVIGEVEVRYKGAVKALNNPPSFPEQLGLSWSNVAPTLWELIPYSFIVDYFSNVGNVIEGVSTGRISLAWGCKSVTKRYRQVIACDIPWDEMSTSEKSELSGSANGAGETGSRTTYSRRQVDNVAFGIRDAEFRLPGMGTKALNLVALATARNRGYYRY